MLYTDFSAVNCNFAVGRELYKMQILYNLGDGKRRGNMLLALDIGNTSISVGLFRMDTGSTQLLHVFNLSSDANRTADEYTVLLINLLRFHEITPDMIHASAMSSVVPALTSVIADTAKFLSGKSPLILGPGVKTGLNIRIDQQTQLGPDLVANTVAALNRMPAPLVAVDFGTATTFSVVDPTGALTGSIICPGLRVSMEALTNSASLLVESELSRPEKFVGKNTHDSVNSGVLNGHILMVDGFIRELRHTLCADSTCRLSLVATGGFSDYVLPYCRNKFTCIPHLTLHGIAEIYLRNM